MFLSRFKKMRRVDTQKRTFQYKYTVNIYTHYKCAKTVYIIIGFRILALTDYYIEFSDHKPNLSKKKKKIVKKMSGLQKSR